MLVRSKKGMESSWLAFTVWMCIVSVVAVTATVLTGIGYVKDRQFITVHNSASPKDDNVTIKNNLTARGKLTVATAVRGEVAVDGASTASSIQIMDVFESNNWKVRASECESYFDTVYWFRLELKAASVIPSVSAATGCMDQWISSLTQFTVTGPSWPRQNLAVADAGHLVPITAELPAGEWLFHWVVKVSSSPASFTFELALDPPPDGVVIPLKPSSTLTTTTGQNTSILTMSGRASVISGKLTLSATAVTAATNATLSQCIFMAIKIA